MKTAFQRLALTVSVVAITCCFGVTKTDAQNINVSTPFTSLNDSFYENFGVNFGFGFRGGRGNGSRVVGYGPQGQLQPNIVFSQNGFAGTIPPFGGYSPNAGATFGFGNVGRNGGYSLGFNFAQGSTRTSTTVAPSLTVQNGFGGSLISGQTRPFVTGMIPVVGGGVPGFSNVMPGYGFDPGYRDIVPMDNGVTRAFRSGQLKLGSRSQPTQRTAPSTPVTFSNKNSSALTGDLSVAQIKAERVKRMAARQRQFESTLAEAKQLESDKRYAEARVKYRAATKLTDDKRLRDQLKQIIKASRSK